MTDNGQMVKKTLESPVRQDPPSSDGEETLSPSKLQELGLFLLTGFIVAAIGALIYLSNRTFYYLGDNPESFVPLWHHFGTELRQGRWFQMEPAGWTGGNYAAEAGYSQWNPISLINYVAVSFFDQLNQAAAFVMIELLALLAGGTYLLARSYGAKRVYAVLVGVAIPFSGFTLFYEATGWPMGLSAFTGIVYFWWAVNLQVQGKFPPVVSYIMGFLAVTTGNPYALLGILIILAGYGLQSLIRKKWQELAHLVVMGATVGVVSYLVIGPLLNVQSLTDRQTLSKISNDTFLVPNIGDLFTSSIPSYIPAITNWGFSPVERYPVIYLAWFILPLLPWLRWGKFKEIAVKNINLLVILVLFLLFVFGPSNFWLFRWPLRLIEYVYLVVLLLFAVLISQGLARGHQKRRVIATAMLMAAALYLSWAVTPVQWLDHLLAMIVVGSLIVIGLVFYFRKGQVALVAVLLLGTGAFALYQTNAFPKNSLDGSPAVEPLQSATAVSTIQKASEQFQGTVLQLAARNARNDDDIESARFLFGNSTWVSGHESIVRYSGIGFKAFSDALCMDFRGNVCSAAYYKVMSLVPDTNIRLIDALGVDTLVLQRASFGGKIAAGPPPGWKVVEDSDRRAVWTRTEPIKTAGRATILPENSTVSDVVSQPYQDAFTIDSSGGQVIFSRLNWTGYKLLVDGQEAPLETAAAGLVSAQIPPGKHSVSLTYTPPVLHVGWLAVGGAFVISLVQTIIWILWRRRVSVASQHEVSDSVTTRKHRNNREDNLRSSAEG